MNSLMHYSVRTPEDGQWEDGKIQDTPELDDDFEDDINFVEDRSSL